MYKYICIYIYICICICICIYACRHVCMCVYVCMNVGMYVNLAMYPYINMFFLVLIPTPCLILTRSLESLQTPLHDKKWRYNWCILQWDPSASIRCRAISGSQSSP